MQKRHEVCKACKFAAPCYGLGLRVILQSIVDREAEWDGKQVNSKVWKKDLEKEGWVRVKRSLPQGCPEYRASEWYVCFDRGGALLVMHAEDMENVTLATSM